MLKNPTGYGAGRRRRASMGEKRSKSELYSPKWEQLCPKSVQAQNKTPLNSGAKQEMEDAGCNNVYFFTKP